MTTKLTSRETLLIKVSWHYAIINSEPVGLSFYQKLFELDPSLKSLFKISVDEQLQKLMGMLTSVVSSIDQLENFASDLKLLAARHIAYGVVDSHYDTAGEALLWSLEHSLGTLWSPEIKVAWSKAYGIIKEMMLS